METVNARAALEAQDRRAILNGYLYELDQTFLTLGIRQGPPDFQIDSRFSETLAVGEELFDASRATTAGMIEVRVMLY